MSDLQTQLRNNQVALLRAKADLSGELSMEVVDDVLVNSISKKIKALEDADYTLQADILEQTPIYDISKMMKAMPDELKNLFGTDKHTN